MESRIKPGARFGRGTVLERIPYRDRADKVRMLCDCGKEFITYSTTLYSKRRVSCGCWLREVRTKHGHSSDPLWARWKIMIARCHNPKNKSYKNYGARGITVCDRWKGSFEAFVEDMGRPLEGMTLERIDNNGPYCKENCKWATCKEQTRNQRTNHYYQVGDRLLILADVAEYVGISYGTLQNRLLRMGMTIDEAITLPIKENQGRFKKGINT